MIMLNGRIRLEGFRNKRVRVIEKRSREKSAKHAAKWLLAMSRRDAHYTGSPLPHERIRYGRTSRTETAFARIGLTQR